MPRRSLCSILTKDAPSVRGRETMPILTADQSPRRNKMSQPISLTENRSSAATEVSKRGRAFGFGSRPGAVRLSMRQRQHSKKLGPADWPIGVFPSQPVSSAVVRKSCCGGSPTMAPKSLIICAWSAKPQA